MIWTLVLLSLLTWTPLTPQPASGDQLLEASRQGDVALVRTLISQGVDVNSKSRYGATALSVAAQRGHLEVVRLLLDAGADVQVRDTFYSSSALRWALSEGHLEIVRLLAEKGAPDSDMALAEGVESGNLELVRAALKGGQVSPDGLQAALSAAQKAGQVEIVKTLADAGVPPPPPPVEVDESILKTYAGRYRNAEMGFGIQVSVQEKGLLLQADGQPPLALLPIDQNHFKSPDFPVQVEFAGRGGLVETVIVRQGTQSFSFAPVEASTAAGSTEGAVADVSPAPALAKMARTAPINWPSFRGDQASGVADGQGVPTTWDGASGQNVKWKTPIPGIANSSPIIWGDRIFVTSAVPSSGDISFRTGLYGDVKPVDDLSEHSFRVFALNKMDGRIIWDRTAYTGAPKVKRHTKASQANSTPVTDGKHIVALFGSIGKMFGYDVEGNLLWTVDLGILDSGWFYDADFQWGHASSPVIYEGLVIVQADIQKGSFLAAYELDTGKQAWRTERDEIPTWGTPTVYRGEPRDELITNGPTIRSYDPRTGQLLWSLGPNSEVTVGTPVVAHGLIFVTGGYPPVRPIYAVRPGFNGDLTLGKGIESSEAVAWSKTRGGTYIPTPLVYGDYLYMTDNNGRLTCYEATTGKQVYQARIGGTGGSYAASPVAADGMIFFTDEEGTTSIVRAGGTYELLAQNKVGEVCMGTPAISDGLLVIRTLQHVYGIGE